MNIEALEELVRVLNAVQSDSRRAESFSLDHWFGSDYVSRPKEEQRMALPEEFEQADHLKTTLIHIPHGCGTTACACGYAGLDPWFRQRGFTTLADGGVQGPEGTFGWTAVREFFQMNHTKAKFLFDPTSYIEGYGDDDHEDEWGEDTRRFDIKPQDVIDRLERTIADGKQSGAPPTNA